MQILGLCDWGGIIPSNAKLNVGNGKFNMSQAVGRYATTLFELAKEANGVDGVEKDLGALLQAFETSPELTGALKSPLYAAQDKIAVLGEIGKKLGTSTLVLNFISVVAQNARAGELPEMFKGFMDLAAKARGAMKAEVATAQELSATQLEDLKASLKQAFNADVEIETKVNPELIGGLVVKVGSRLFDDSVKTKLEALKNSLKGA
jgi:F-type H+-transporting ATPase subunit delta